MNDQHESLAWACRWSIAKWSREADHAAGAPPDEVVDHAGNLVVTTGRSLLLNLLQGNGGTVFDATNAYIGVGDSATAAAIGQTNLVAATNKLRKLVKQPPTVVGNVATWVVDFTSGEANFAWQEWALFNAASAGTMLNRAVQSNGTKTVGALWTMTVTIALT